VAEVLTALRATWFRVYRARGPVWWGKTGYLIDAERDRSGVDRVWPSAGGYFTKRNAEDWLRGVPDEARRGTLPGDGPLGVAVIRLAPRNRMDYIGSRYNAFRGDHQPQNR
jgi:hypothetical protein